MESPSMVERRIAGAAVKLFWMRDRRGGPWLPPAHLRWSPKTFEGNTGARLAGHWFPHERPRGAVVLAHPDRRYAKHWFVREGWVEWLLQNRFEVLTFDFTGYGESVGPATYYHEDVLAAVGVARREAGGLPVHVVGVSMGAFAAANASPRLEGVEGLVLESPYPSFEAWYGRGAGALGMRAFNAAFRRTAGLLHADRNLAQAAPRRILVAIAGEDTVTRPDLSLAVAAAGPAERTRVARVEKATHLGLFQHEAYRRAVLETLTGEKVA